MKTYLIALFGTLLLTGCDKIQFSKADEQAPFGFEVRGDKLFRFNRKTGEIKMHWVEAGILKNLNNHRPPLTGTDRFKDENEKEIYYIGNGKLTHDSIAYVNEIIKSRKEKEELKKKTEHFQLRFIGDNVLRISEISGSVMAYCPTNGKLEHISEETKKLIIGKLLTDENGKRAVYVGNGAMDYSSDQVNKAILREYDLSEDLLEAKPKH